MYIVTLAPQPARRAVVRFMRDRGEVELHAVPAISYTLREMPSGELIWECRNIHFGASESPVATIVDTGWLQGQAVTPDDAEAITGLHYPAAMDRLRELVHASS